MAESKSTTTARARLYSRLAETIESTVRVCSAGVQRGR